MASPTYTGMALADFIGPADLTSTGELGTILRRPLATDDSTARTIRARLVNRALRRIQRNHSWRCLEGQGDTSLSTTADDPLVALPARYKEQLSVYLRDAAGELTRVWSTVYVGGVSVITGIPNPPLTLPLGTSPTRSGELAVTPDWIREHWPDPSDTDQPVVCCVDGEYVRFGPTPDAAYDLSCYFTGYLADLDDTNTRNWFTEHLEAGVLHTAAALGFLDLGEGDEAARHLQVAQSEIDEQLHVEHRERSRRRGPGGPVIKGGYA